MQEFAAVLDALPVDEREPMLGDGLMGVVMGKAKVKKAPPHQRCAVRRRRMSAVRPVRVHEGVLTKAHRSHANTVIPTFRLASIDDVH
jgi:hypothetical protein